MIRVDALCKTYGSFQAVKDLSFRVDAGEVVGFLGPNGAGKSTTLRIISGFLGATSGDVTIDGKSVAKEPLAAKERIGYMPEASPLYPEMRVDEYLFYRAELKRVRRGARKAAVGKAIEDAGLTAVDRVLIGQLSKGYRQRVGLADALVSSPPLLLLDEPTAGLDPNQIREVRALIKRLKEKHTILLSTHILSEVEAVCTRGIVIARGELVAEGSIAELRALRRPRAIRIRLRGEAAVAKRALGDVAGVVEVSIETQPSDPTPRILVGISNPAAADATTERVVQALGQARLGVLEVTPMSSLEQVFAELTEKAALPALDLGKKKPEKAQREVEPS